MRSFPISNRVNSTCTKFISNIYMYNYKLVEFVNKSPTIGWAIYIEKVKQENGINNNNNNKTNLLVMRIRGVV